MKRFYDAVSVIAGDGGYGPALDGRPVRTPKRAMLAVPSMALAQAIADEWVEQEQDILPQTMRLTGIANAAIDLVRPDPSGFAQPLAAYAETDLLCYRGTDSDLVARQAAEWNPLLDWAEQRFGIEFILTSGIMHRPQPPATVAALAGELLAKDAFRLAALAPLITIGGSLVAALALVEGAMAADALWQAVTLDERWQEERWGADAEAAAARALKQQEWMAAARFVALLG